MQHNCLNLRVVSVFIPGCERTALSLVDKADFPLVSKYRWQMAPQGEARASLWNSETKKAVTIRMHRLITDCPKGMQVDHKNHDCLDNRRSNLRICTNAQNAWNKKSYKNSSSRFKGVYWFRVQKRWAASIQHNKTRHFLGYFDFEIEAARAYDAAARELHGDFASLNFP